MRQRVEMKGRVWLAVLRFTVLTLFIMLISPITKAALNCNTHYGNDANAALAQCQNEVAFHTDPSQNGFYDPVSGCTYQGQSGICAGVWGNPTSTQCFTHAFDTHCYGFYEDMCTAPEVFNPSTGACDPPPPSECGDPQGTIKHFQVGAQAQQSICHNDCIYNFNNTLGGLLITGSGGVSSTSVQYESTGNLCNGNEPTNTQGNNSNVTDSDSNGLPEIDGQELPPTPPPSNGCVLLGNGSLYCGSGAPTPPAPDNGTPGMGATPDQTVTNTNNNTTNNYFGPGTSSGSSTGTPDAQDPGVCDPSVETCGTDENSASDGGCGQLPNCTGDPILCVTLKMQHDTRCNLQTDIEDVTEADVMGQIGVTQTIEDWVAEQDANTDNNIDVNTEFFTTQVGTASCPAPLTFDIPKVGPTSVPLTDLCNVLDLIKPAVILFANIIAGLMLFRAFSEGL